MSEKELCVLSSKSLGRYLIHRRSLVSGLKISARIFTDLPHTQAVRHDLKGNILVAMEVRQDQSQAQLFMARSKPLPKLPRPGQRTRLFGRRSESRTSNHLAAESFVALTSVSIRWTRAKCSPRVTICTTSTSSRGIASWPVSVALFVWSRSTVKCPYRR